MPKAQTKFIKALDNVLKKQDFSNSYLDLNPKLHIKSDFRKNEYIDSNIMEVLNLILYKFNSTFDFSNRQLPVDCCIVNHPTLKSRIVEFDEAQHFSEQRYLTIKLLQTTTQLHFFQEYINLLKDSIVSSTFKKVVSGRSGFTNPTPGFRFKCGRTYQRAFYDTLKDVAHLSKYNSHLLPIIRFSVFEFEFVTKKPFMDIPMDILETIIDEKLKSLK